MDKQSLLDYGFRQFEINQHDKYDEFFQFKVRIGNSTKCFINVRFWDFKQFGAEENGWDAEMHSEDSNGVSFYINRSCRKETPEEIVNWFLNIFNTLNCNYYEVNGN